MLGEGDDWQSMRRVRIPEDALEDLNQGFLF